MVVVPGLDWGLRHKVARGGGEELGERRRGDVGVIDDAR